MEGQELQIKLINEENKNEDEDSIIVVDFDKKDKKDDDFEDDDEEKEIEEDNNINKETPGRKSIDRTAQDKLLLVDMGFDKLLVDRIYSRVFPTNLEDALDYLQKDDNDKYTHSYIADDLGLCSICGKIRSAHAGESLSIEKERETETQLNINSNKYTSTYKSTYNRFSNNYGKKECGVCMDEISYADLSKIKIPCKHNFCIDCWFEYLKEKINNANVYKLSCMDHKCGYILEEKFIKSIIGSDKVLSEKYEKFLTRKKLMDTNKKIKFCPIPDCDGYAEKKKKINM